MSIKKQGNSKFMILATARSGSTWLVDAIGRIDGVTCFDELFSGKKGAIKSGDAKSVQTFESYRTTRAGIRPFITFKYLGEVFSKGSIVGFKMLMAHQKRFPEVLLYLLIKRIAIIHLFRENTLDMLVSKKAAWLRGKFNYKKGEQMPPEVVLTYPVDKLLTDLRYAERRTNQAKWFLKFTRIRRIGVKYEGLLKGPLAFKPVWEFLGIDFESNPPEWETQKIRKKKLNELLANYDEVEQALENTRYSRHLRDEV